MKSLIQLIPADLDVIHLEMESLLTKNIRNPSMFDWKHRFDVRKVEAVLQCFLGYSMALFLHVLWLLVSKSKGSLWSQLTSAQQNWIWLVINRVLAQDVGSSYLDFLCPGCKSFFYGFMCPRCGLFFVLLFEWGIPIGYFQFESYPRVTFYL